MGNNKGLFITVEGIEGSGKSTAVKFLTHYFQTRGFAVGVTREPGGTEIAEAIRHLILKQYDETMVADTELLLMFASRAQHITKVIKPALLAGKILLSDRFTDATYAYQGGGRGVSVERIAILERWVQSDLQPDLTLLLDIPMEVGLKRILSRGVRDRIEHEEIAFFERVRQTYLQRAKKYPNRFEVIDATCSQKEVEQCIKEIVRKVCSVHFGRSMELGFD